MTAGRVAVDVAMGGVLASLISLGVFAVAAAAAAALTLLRARSGRLRRRARLRQLGLAGFDEIDEALDRIAAHEHGASLLPLP